MFITLRKGRETSMTFNHFAIFLTTTVVLSACGGSGDSLIPETLPEQVISESSNDPVPDEDSQTSEVIEPTTGDAQSPIIDPPSTDETSQDLGPIDNPNSDDIATANVNLTFRSTPIPLLPPRCVGAIDNAGSIFCVDPETRELSATLSDGSLWWSFILPGSNDSNEVESVLVTDDWLILIADRLPTATALTPVQRNNQYEASVFQKDGMFIQTVALTNELMSGDSEEPREVLLMSAPVVAHQSDTGSPQITIGFKSWAIPLPGEGSLLASYDLLSGEMLTSQAYLDQSIYQIMSDADGSGVLQVIADFAGNTEVKWHEIGTLSRLSDNTVDSIFADSLINLPSGEQPQLNAGNYLEVINQVLPWINADKPSELLFGSADVAPTRDSQLTVDDFSLLEQVSDSHRLYGCSNQGLVARDFDTNTLNTVYELDQCSTLNAIYSGVLQENLGSRGGFFYSAESVTRVNVDENSSLQGGVVYVGTDSNNVPSFEVSGGDYTSSDQFILTDAENSLNNAIVDNFSSLARFQYGPQPGNQNVVCYTAFPEGSSTPIGRFFCNLIKVNGRIESSFTVNAEWSSYSPVTVDANLVFGNDYFEGIVWSGPAEDEPELPASIITSPASEFYFQSGSIEITAADNSRLVLLPIENQFPLMSVRLFDSNDLEIGNFPLVSVNIECAERLGESCVVQQ